MDLLTGLGQRVRQARQAKKWTQAELAKRAGVSLRFLVDLEGGNGNISVMRLSEIAEALSVSLVTLFAGLGAIRDDADDVACLDPLQRKQLLVAARAPGHIALVGLRGAGKTSIGKPLAEKLGARFVEVDHEVESTAGMRLGEIFEYHGAGRYRELERQVLERLLGEPGDMVLATGGSIVTDQATWGWLRRSSRTVWLKATPETHLSRVEAQGDFRPMRGRANALTELKSILARRSPLYAQAGLTVDTEQAGIDGSVQKIVDWTKV